MSVKSPNLVFLHPEDQSDCLTLAHNAGFDAPFSVHSFTGFTSQLQGNTYNGGLYSAVINSDTLFVSERLVMRGSLDARRALLAARDAEMDEVILFNSLGILCRTDLNEFQLAGAIS